MSKEQATTEMIEMEDAFSMQAVVDNYLITLPTVYGGLTGWALDNSNETYMYGLEPGQINTLKLYKDNDIIELCVKNESGKSLNSFAGSTIIGVEIYYTGDNHVVGVNADDTEESLVAKYGEPVVNTDDSCSWVKDGNTVTVNFRENRVNSVEIMVADDSFID